MPDITLEAEVKRIFEESRRNYGTRKIQVELRKKGLQVSRRKIGEIMKKNNLVSNYIKHRPKTRRAKPNEDDCPNILNREFNRDNSLDVVVSSRIN